jgi:hypothetical protein
MGAAGRRSSPRGLPRPWGGDEGMRRTALSPERGDMPGPIHEIVTRALAPEEMLHKLDGVDDLSSL